jgi:hypothetical protein
LEGPLFYTLISQRMPKLVLDTALQNINPKKSITADVYATKIAV